MKREEQLVNLLRTLDLEVRTAIADQVCYGVSAPGSRKTRLRLWRLSRVRERVVRRLLNAWAFDDIVYVRAPVVVEGVGFPRPLTADERAELQAFDDADACFGQSR